MDNRIRVVTLTSDATLGKNDSGSLIVLNSADGIKVTLPTLSRGLFYDFVVRTAVTAPDKYEIVTQTADKLRGVLVNSKNDTASKGFVATSSDEISMNGSTTGGLVGTHFRIVADDEVWNVYGQNTSSGSEATPFA
jgi:hypothetical protein